MSRGTPIPNFITNGRRDRLRAAFRALCWWKPWYSYHAMQHYGIKMYDDGFTAGLKAGRVAGYAQRSLEQLRRTAAGRAAVRGEVRLAVKPDGGEGR